MHKKPIYGGRIDSDFFKIYTAVRLRMKSSFRFAFLMNIVIAAALLNGCGYSVHRHASLPFQEIGIGTIENRTVEPKLQDRLQRALAEEFLKQGISVSPSAPHKINGVINAFDMAGISAKDNISVEYRVIIDADFALFDGEKKIRDIKHVQSPFIVSFTGAANLNSLLAAKEVAEDKAMNDVAMEIVGALMFK
jgi:hypothetical protein